jgi:beta-N-acetylhexosaminidase
MINKLRHLIVHCIFIIPLIVSCQTKGNNESSINSQIKNKEEQQPAYSFTLTDFYSENPQLDSVVQNKINSMDLKSKVAQLIMPAMGEHGQPKETIDQLVKDGLIGGILMLNGTKEEFGTWSSTYNKWNDSLGNLPFLYSADAEPSLVNRKIRNTTPVSKANTLKNIQEVTQVAQTISKELNEIGINYNFAPVVDMSPNKTVGWRSFGHQPENVIPWSNAFIQTTQQHQIIATAKHFPGHGYVVGDTHKKLVYIEGEMKEIQNYPELIKNGVLSIMIAHIAVKENTHYSTDDMPATTSRKIVTALLKDSLQFKGLIITDALNMGGVSTIQKANQLAIEAGCDILLMPLNARKAHQEIMNAYESSETVQKEVNNSVEKIVRMKYCLGLIQ